MLIGSFVGRGSFQYKGLEKAGQAACSGDSGEASGDRGEEREVVGDEPSILVWVRLKECTFLCFSYCSLEIEHGNALCRVSFLSIIVS